MSKPTSVIDKVSQPNGPPKNLPQSRERHPHELINPDDIVDPDISRLIQKVQESGKDATLPARTDPTVGGEIHNNVVLTAGKTINIAHGLGEPARYYSCWGAQPNSQSFAAVRAVTTLSPSKYLVLLALSNGTYDIKICPG